MGLNWASSVGDSLPYHYIIAPSTHFGSSITLKRDNTETLISRLAADNVEL